MFPPIVRANHVKSHSFAVAAQRNNPATQVSGRSLWLITAVILTLPLAAGTAMAGPLRYLFGGERYQPQWQDQGNPQGAPFIRPYGAGPESKPGINTPTSPLSKKHHGPRKFPSLMSGGPRPQVAPSAPGLINFPNRELVGTVIIVNRTCRLYLTVSKTEAFEYPISIGRQGFKWTGTEKISRIADWPDWIPPAEMRKRQPELPIKMTGGLNNPLGARALYLGDSLYRIHGTNNAKTIGRAASSGCFRMLNEHVMHLSGLVHNGTPVRVVKNWPLNRTTTDLRDAELACAAEIPASRR